MSHESWRLRARLVYTKQMLKLAQNKAKKTADKGKKLSKCVDDNSKDKRKRKREDEGKFVKKSQKFTKKVALSRIFDDPDSDSDNMDVSSDDYL